MTRAGTLEEVVEAVERHYASSDKPLFLSRLGQQLAGVNFQGFGGLASAIGQVSGNRLAIINPTGSPGTEIVLFSRRGFEQVSREVANIARAHELRMAHREAVRQFDSLPVSIRLAFCAVTGERVALTLSPPFRYVRLAPEDSVGAGQLVIEDQFRCSGLNLRQASKNDRASLWYKFVAWTAGYGLRKEDFFLER